MHIFTSQEKFMLKRREDTVFFLLNFYIASKTKEAKEKEMNRIKILRSYMKGNLLKYVGALVSILLAVLASLMIPLVIRTTFDSIFDVEPLEKSSTIGGLFLKLGGRDEILQNLWIPGLLIIGLTILSGVFLFFRAKWSAEASESIARNLRDKLFGHLQELSYEYHVSAETGDLIQRCTSDVDVIRRFLGQQLVEIGRSVFMVTAITIIMMKLYMPLGLLSLIIIPVIFSYSFFFFKKIQASFKIIDEADGAMSTAIQENLTGVRVVRAFGRQSHEIDKFKEKNLHMRDSVYKLNKLFAQYWSTSDLMCLAQTVMVLSVGTVFVVQGKMTVGTLFAFVAYMGMLLWPVRQLGRILQDMSKSFVAVDRIQEILEVPSEMTDSGESFEEISGDIEFDNVSFSYDDGRKILKNMSFKIKQGETLAILGPTGSGKSTLVHLLARLYDATEGQINIDGKDIKSFDKKHLRHHIGIILQEPFLFAKSIRDNIKVSQIEASDEVVEHAAKTAVIHDKILDFSEGYETLVGERGVSLSGGQKQRMAIARRVITEAPVIVFDDSLSAVDTETDAAIRHRLSHNNKDLTTVIISHRVATLSEADRIMVIEDGEITQLGTHETLIRNDGMYKRIWTIQNSESSKEAI